MHAAEVYITEDGDVSKVWDAGFGLGNCIRSSNVHVARSAARGVVCAAYGTIHGVVEFYYSQDLSGSLKTGFKASQSCRTFVDRVIQIIDGVRYIVKFVAQQVKYRLL